MRIGFVRAMIGIAAVVASALGTATVAEAGTTGPSKCYNYTYDVTQPANIDFGQTICQSGTGYYQTSVLCSYNGTFTTRYGNLRYINGKYQGDSRAYCASKEQILAVGMNVQKTSVVGAAPSGPSKCYNYKYDVAQPAHIDFGQTICSAGVGYYQTIVVCSYNGTLSTRYGTVRYVNGSYQQDSRAYCVSKEQIVAVGMNTWMN